MLCSFLVRRRYDASNRRASSAHAVLVAKMKSIVARRFACFVFLLAASAHEPGLRVNSGTPWLCVAPRPSCGCESSAQICGCARPNNSGTTNAAVRIGATAVSLRPVSLVWPVCSSRSHRNSQLCVLLVAAWPHVCGKLTTLDVKATDRNTQKKDTEKRRRSVCERACAQQERKRGVLYFNLHH
jgi:hypothetical protein